MMPPDRSPQPADWNSQLYDTQLHFVSAYGQGALDWLAPQEGERVLDLGCGTGDLTAQLARTGAAVYGMDASPSMIEEARRKYPGLAFTVADAQDFRAAEPYDAVFSNAALHWMTRPADVAGCVARALRPEGRFVGEFGARGNVERVVRALEAAVSRRGIDAAARNPWYFPTAGQYAAVLEDAGFLVRRIATFERPTLMPDGDQGLRHWLTMFGGSYWTGLEPAEVDAIVAEVEEAIRPELLTEKGWMLDYVRLRFEAVLKKM